MKVNRKTKAAREALGDIDYEDKLNEEEAAWLETFVRATVTNSVDDMEILVKGDGQKLAKLQRELFAEDHAKRRDICYVGTRVDMEDDLVSFGDARSVDFGQSINVCRRCMKKRCCCGPRFQVQPKKYDQADYVPIERTEDTMISELDLAKRMEAFDLLPYGDSPKGLEQGHAVKICLPHHLLDKALGYVLAFREVSGEMLVRSMSKTGLRDKDGTRPAATVLYVKPEALKRSRPELVKAFSPSADKKNGGNTK